MGHPLNAADVRRILEGSALEESAADPLVIGRLDYYIHNHVMQLDFARPNAYLPRARWEAEVAGLPEQFTGQRWFWEQLRHRAWVDDAETVINTHPFGYIGADNKGTDQILAMPGGKNRDSHATYPFAGTYKDIGPSGASEEVAGWTDLRAYLADPSSLRETPFTRGWVLRLDEPGRIQVVPDWERVMPLVMGDVDARKRWSWLVLPLRWGYPAAASPFAGIVSHAETGNIAVTGPAYSTGWNRSGASGGFTPLEPQRFSGFFALGWQDTFNNDWGFLNATLPTATILPPFDLAFRLLLAPVRIARGRNTSTFFDTEEVPFRFIGTVFGGGWEKVPDEFIGLLTNTEQVTQIILRAQEVDPTLTSALGNSFSRNGHTVFGGITLFVGRKFQSENLLKHTRADIADETALSGQSEPFVVQSELDLWEYVGSLRYVLATGGLQPYGRAGWGWSWYSLQDVTTQGVPLDTPDSPRVDNFTWHYGVGLEFIPIAGRARGTRGIDAAIRGDIVWYRHKLGADQIAEPILVAAGGVTTGSVTRRQVSLALTISF